MSQERDSSHVRQISHLVHQVLKEIPVRLGTLDRQDSQVLEEKMALLHLLDQLDIQDQQGTLDIPDGQV